MTHDPTRPPTSADPDTVEPLADTPPVGASPAGTRPTEPASAGAYRNSDRPEGANWMPWAIGLVVLLLLLLLLWWAMAGDDTTEIGPGTPDSGIVDPSASPVQ